MRHYSVLLTSSICLLPTMGFCQSAGVNSDPQNPANYSLSKISDNHGRSIQVNPFGVNVSNIATPYAVANIFFERTPTFPDGNISRSADFTAKDTWTVSWIGVGNAPANVRVKMYTCLTQSTPFPTSRPTQDEVGGSIFKILTLSSGTQKAESTTVKLVSLQNGSGNIELKGKGSVVGANKQNSDEQFDSTWISNVVIDTKAVRLRPVVHPTIYCKWINDEPIPTHRPIDVFSPIKSDLVVTRIPFVFGGTVPTSATALLVGNWPQPNTVTYSFVTTGKIQITNTDNRVVGFVPVYSDLEYKELVKAPQQATIEVTATDSDGSEVGVVDYDVHAELESCGKQGWVRYSYIKIHPTPVTIEPFNAITLNEGIGFSISETRTHELSASLSAPGVFIEPAYAFSWGHTFEDSYYQEEAVTVDGGPGPGARRLYMCVRREEFWMEHKFLQYDTAGYIGISRPSLNGNAKWVPLSINEIGPIFLPGPVFVKDAEEIIVEPYN